MPGRKERGDKKLTRGCRDGVDKSLRAVTKKDLESDGPILEDLGVKHRRFIMFSHTKMNFHAHRNTKICTRKHQHTYRNAHTNFTQQAYSILFYSTLIQVKTQAHKHIHTQFSHLQNIHTQTSSHQYTYTQNTSIQACNSHKRAYISKHAQNTAM